MPWAVVVSAGRISAGARHLARRRVKANPPYSRAAPQFNLFGVGFPITLVFGLAIILAGLPAMQTTFVHLLSDAFDLLRKLSAPGS